MAAAALNADHTITRVKGEKALIDAGLSSKDRFEEMAKSHKMTFRYDYLDPNNAKRFDRPLVDVSAPRNLLNENDRVALEGGGMRTKGAWWGLSMGHFQGVQEPVPYTYTHHNYDFLVQGVMFCNALFFNWYISRTQIGGSQMGHPHTQWAHNVVMGAGMVRAFLGGCIAFGGSLYTYEYLYTHAPWFKIRDPSTNGWTRPWEEGQSTMCARLISMMWFPVAAAFFTGTAKRFHFNTGMALTGGWAYETLRTSVAGMYSMQLKERANRQNDRDGQAGSLNLSTEKRMDYATGALASDLNTKYANYNQSKLRELGWTENCFDNLPLAAAYRKERNHRFNWTFARTSTGERQYKYKNESWEMPDVLLQARTHTDVYDKVKAQSPIVHQLAAL